MSVVGSRLANQHISGSSVNAYLRIVMGEKTVMGDA